MCRKESEGKVAFHYLAAVLLQLPVAAVAAVITAVKRLAAVA